MPDSEANEPSKADLERRVDQLEATVQKMMPTRRGVLTGLAGAGIGGAAVYGATDPARAQAAGQVGTGTDPVDVEAWNLNVANQVTSDLAMNGNDVTDVGAMDVDISNVSQVAGFVRGGSGQIIADSSITRVEFQNTVFEDTDVVEWDAVNNEWQIKRAGTYFVSASIIFDDDIGWSDADMIQLRLGDGDFSSHFDRFRKVGQDSQSLGSQHISKASAGSSIGVNTFQTSGSGKSLRDGTSSTRFLIMRLG